MDINDNDRKIIYSARHVVKHSDDNSRCESKQYADAMYLESGTGELPLFKVC